MFNEFIFQKLIDDIQEFDLEVTAFRKIHDMHMGIIVETTNNSDIFNQINIIIEIIKSYNLLTTHIVYNDESNDCLFECIAISNFGVN